jgi:predicted cupin superfamily sugar epimerase
MNRPATAELLDLAPHPEGGWFKETWRSPITFNPAGYAGSRASATAIYFLLRPGEVSRWHVVSSAELWFWHSGGPLTLRLGGTGTQPAEPAELLLGNDLARGHTPQILVPANTWQSAEPASDQEVLVSCVVSPGFDFADFILLP